MKTNLYDELLIVLREMKSRTDIRKLKAFIKKYEERLREEMNK